jgi:hypothetical protein
MKKRELVKAQTFSGEYTSRVVVEVRGETVYLCTEKEWDLANKDQREPLCVGFNKRYVREV